MSGEEAAGPSLLEAATKKADKPTLLRSQPSQPKKGARSKGTRIDIGSLGFRTEIEEQKSDPVVPASSSVPSKETSWPVAQEESREAVSAEPDTTSAAEPEVAVVA